MQLKPPGKGPKLALRGDGVEARQPQAGSGKAAASDAEAKAGVRLVKDEPMPDAAEAKEPDAAPPVADAGLGALFCAIYLGCSQ